MVPSHNETFFFKLAYFFLFWYKNGYILRKGSFILLQVGYLGQLGQLDNNLDTLPRTTKEFDAKVRVQLQKRKRLHYQIYRAQSLSSYYQSLLNHENPFVPAKFRAKVNITTPEYEKEIRRKQSIDTMKREIDILD